MNITESFMIVGVLNRFQDTFDSAEGLYSVLEITSEQRDLKRKHLEDFKTKKWVSIDDVEEALKELSHIVGEATFVKGAGAIYHKLASITDALQSSKSHKVKP